MGAVILFKQEDYFLTIKEEIIKSIDEIVEKRVQNLSRDASGVVLEIKNKKYKVNIDGADHWIKDGVGINPNVGTAVWIYKPYGQIRNAYICGLK